MVVVLLSRVFNQQCLIVELECTSTLYLFRRAIRIEMFTSDLRTFAPKSSHVQIFLKL